MHGRLWARVFTAFRWKTKLETERPRRLWGLEEGSSSESWLSSQEALFLTALHKHWKRDAKENVPDSLFPL